MICLNCGRPIAVENGVYVHTNAGYVTCDLPRTHPNFMLAQAEPDENYCAEKEENGTCIHSDHTQ